MSESINGNEGRRIIDRKGRGQSNRWQRKAKLTGRRIRARKIINGRQRKNRQRGNCLGTQRVRRGKVVESWHRAKLRRKLTEDAMETRKRAREVEELEATERRDRDRKGRR